MGLDVYLCTHNANTRARDDAGRFWDEYQGGSLILAKAGELETR